MVGVFYFLVGGFVLRVVVGLSFLWLGGFWVGWVLGFGVGWVDLGGSLVFLLSRWGWYNMVSRLVWCLFWRWVGLGLDFVGFVLGWVLGFGGFLDGFGFLCGGLVEFGGFCGWVGGRWVLCGGLVGFVW